jgi:hypothetical protein
MRFKPLLPFNEVIKNNKLSFRDKLVYCYCYFLHSDEDIVESDNIVILKNILLNSQTNKDLFILVQNFIDKNNLPDLLIARLRSIIDIYDSKFDDELSYMKNNDLKEKIILKEKDFLPFASKSVIGGMRDGYIACSLKNLDLFLIKKASKTVKFQDECFLNRVSKLIIKNYCPFDTYLVDNLMIAVTLVDNSFDLRKFNRNKDFQMKDIEEFRELNFNFYKKIFKKKKVHGLIANIISSTILLNRDFHNGNSMICENFGETNDVLFFNIDPTHWSMNNKYNINTNEFSSKIQSLVSDFSNSKFIDMDLFRRQLSRFIVLSLKVKYDYFLGRILTGIIYLDKRFENHDEVEAHQTIKTVSMNQFIDLLPHIINNLSDDEILDELRVFLDVDFDKIINLHDKFYNKDGEIYKLSIENKDNLEYGVQDCFVDNLRFNILNLQKKIRTLLQFNKCIF